MGKRPSNIILTTLKEKRPCLLGYDIPVQPLTDISQSTECLNYDKQRPLIGIEHTLQGCYVLFPRECFKYSCSLGASQ